MALNRRGIIQDDLVISIELSMSIGHRNLREQTLVLCRSAFCLIFFRNPRDGIIM